MKPRTALALTAAILAGVLGVLSQLALANHNPGATEHTSIGPNGGNDSTKDAFFDATSDTGQHAFFETDESLVVDDTDGANDVYERSNGATALVSTGPSGNGPSPVTFDDASTDGLHVFFETEDSLVPADADSSVDVYDRSGGTTTLISTGPDGGNGATDAAYRGASDDGTHVFFETTESLVTGDMDSSLDVYERFGATTTLVSIGAGGGNGTPAASFAAASSDGSSVLFDTTERLVGSDTDSSLDLYQRSGGVTSRVSHGPAGGNGAFDALFAGASDDLTRVFFHTQEKMATADTDSSFDVYEKRPTGVTALVSTGPAGGNGAADAFLRGTSADGTRAFFETSERLTGDDTDSQTDVYQRRSGTTTLLSPGTGAFPALYLGSSADGIRVYFDTNEPLVGTDTDLQGDVYQSAAGSTVLISTGPTGGNGPFPARFDGASDDGSRIFFHTDEQLTGDDIDSFTDIYERSAQGTTRVSQGPDGGNGNNFADFAGASLEGTWVFFHTDESLVTTDIDTAQDVYGARIVGYPRTRGATPFRASLVPAFAQCTDPDNTHGAPLDDPSCTTPSQTSANLTIGTPDSNGAFANFAGFVRLDVNAGVPGPPDDSDVAITASITDVRCGADGFACGASNNASGADYTGELRLELPVRLTDQLNASEEGPATEAGTVQDFTISAAIGCTATGGDTIRGSDCALTSSLDAIAPGAAAEGTRGTFELDQVRVLDGGSDGDASTAPNQLFAVQGIFVP